MMNIDKVLYIDLNNYYDRNKAITLIKQNITPIIQLYNFTLDNIQNYNYIFIYKSYGNIVLLGAHTLDKDLNVAVLYRSANKFGRTRVNNFINLLKQL